jgi:argininosuccinate synthase
MEMSLKQYIPFISKCRKSFQAIEAIKYAKCRCKTYTEAQALKWPNCFDLIFQTIAPEIEIINSIRDLKLSRQEEVDYLAKNGVHYGKSTIFYQQRIMGN